MMAEKKKKEKKYTIGNRTAFPEMCYKPGCIPVGTSRQKDVFFWSQIRHNVANQFETSILRLSVTSFRRVFMTSFKRHIFGSIIPINTNNPSYESSLFRLQYDTIIILLL